jgi:predicted RNA-binding Zn-ribbon protein involved in translation (DUF1610 family)
MNQIEIECPECGNEALLVREAVYEGFAKVGEKLRCSNCGHIFASEEDVSFKTRRQAAVFDESDKSPLIEVFAPDENRAICRHCRNYVVNPFTQWCGRHRKEVAATDSCDDFEAKDEE